MIKEMVEVAHHVVSPNNIHGLRGEVMYSGGYGVWTVKSGQEIQVLDDRIRVFEVKFFGEAYSKKSYWDTVTIAVFDNVKDFISWCMVNGEKSEGGTIIDQGMWD